MSKWNEVPSGTLQAAQQRLWTACGDSASVIAEKLKNDESFSNAIARFASEYLGGSLPVARPKHANPVDDTDRQIREEFNLDPCRIAISLRNESRDLHVDESQAMLHLMARLPIVVSRSLAEAAQILKTGEARS